MSTLSQTFGPAGDAGVAAPRRIARRALGWLLALDALARERHAMRDLDARTLRDIGVSPGDLACALRRPEAHLRSIRLRGGDQLQH